MPPPLRSSPRGEEALRAAAPLRPRLDEAGGGLVAQDAEGLLESGDLRLAAGLPLLVGLRFGDAALLDLAVVLQHGSKLGGGSVLVAGELRDGFIQTLEFL